MVSRLHAESPDNGYSAQPAQRKPTASGDGASGLAGSPAVGLSVVVLDGGEIAGPWVKVPVTRATVPESGAEAVMRGQRHPAVGVLPSPSASHRQATWVARASVSTGVASCSRSASMGDLPRRPRRGWTNQLTRPSWVMVGSSPSTSAKPSTTPSGPSGSNCQIGNRSFPASRTATSVPAATRSWGVCRVAAPSNEATSVAVKASRRSDRRNRKPRRRFARWADTTRRPSGTGRPVTGDTA
jgi:hypothetical protein